MNESEMIDFLVEILKHIEKVIDHYHRISRSLERVIQNELFNRAAGYYRKLKKRRVIK